MIVQVDTDIHGHNLLPREGDEHGKSFLPSASLDSIQTEKWGWKLSASSSGSTHLCSIQVTNNWEPYSPPSSPPPNIRAPLGLKISKGTLKQRGQPQWCKGWSPGGTSAQKWRPQGHLPFGHQHHSTDWKELLTGTKAPGNVVCGDNTFHQPRRKKRALIGNKRESSTYDLPPQARTAKPPYCTCHPHACRISKYSVRRTAAFSTVVLAAGLSPLPWIVWWTHVSG